MKRGGAEDGLEPTALRAGRRGPDGLRSKEGSPLAFDVAHFRGYKNLVTVMQTGGAGNRTPPDDQRTLTSFTYNVANQLTAAGATT